MSYLYQVVEPDENIRVAVEMAADFASKDLGVENFEIKYIKLADRVEQLGYKIGKCVGDFRVWDEYLDIDADVTGHVNIHQRKIYVNMHQSSVQAGLTIFHEIKHLHDFDLGIIHPLGYDSKFAEDRATAYEIEGATKMVDHYEREYGVCEVV